MPYKLRKAPRRELYWVVAEDGSKMSKDPIPRERAEKQMKALYIAMRQKRAKRGGGADLSTIFTEGIKIYNFTAAQRKKALRDTTAFMYRRLLLNDPNDTMFDIYADAHDKLSEDYRYINRGQIGDVCDAAIDDIKRYIAEVQGRLVVAPAA